MGFTGLCLYRGPGLDFASSLLKRNAEFLNVKVEEVPNLVQNLCEALRAPPPAADGEPAAKKAKTAVDLELEAGVLAFCRAWQAAVEERARRELHESRPKRVLKFIENSNHKSERLPVDDGDSLHRVVTSVAEVRAALNEPCPTPEGDGQLAALEETVLRTTFVLKGQNLCLVDINKGDVEMLPAGPWNDDERYHLPYEPLATWTVVLRGLLEVGNRYLSVHRVPQDYLVEFTDHVLGQCEGRMLRSHAISAVAPPSVDGSAGLRGAPVDAAHVDARDPRVRSQPEISLNAGGLAPTDFVASTVRQLTRDCAHQLHAIAAQHSQRYTAWLSGRGESAPKITSPGLGFRV